MEALKLDVMNDVTYEDYEKWPEYPRYEIIDGVPYMMASPSRLHQVVIGRMFAKMFNQLEGKKCQPYIAPFDVRLFPTAFSDGKTVVQPDIMVVCDENKVDDKGVKGGPEFVIEVLSPSTGRMDRVTKMNQYERAGVLEYWVVDPPHRTVAVHLLKNGKFARPAEYGLGDVIKVTVVPGLTIDLNDIFDPLPDESDEEGTIRL